MSHKANAQITRDKGASMSRYVSFSPPTGGCLARIIYFFEIQGVIKRYIQIVGLNVDIPI